MDAGGLDMIRPVSPGACFRATVSKEKPLQVVGAINAYAARLAERAGFRALYVSGGGVAASSLGVPDLGISTMDDVLTDVQRITEELKIGNSPLSTTPLPELSNRLSPDSPIISIYLVYYYKSCFGVLVQDINKQLRGPPDKFLLLLSSDASLCYLDIYKRHSTLLLNLLNGE